MGDVPSSEAPSEGTKSVQRGIVVATVLLVFFGLVLIGLAIFLASNPRNTGPGVRIVRDLLIIAMALEIIVVGAAFTLFLIQLARLVNLVHNEVEPLIDAASDTINTVRGTAAFLSKNLVEPVTSVSSTLRGVSKVVGDVDAIRKAAGVVMSAANSASATGATSHPDDTVEPAKAGKSKVGRRASRRQTQKATNKARTGKKSKEEV
jgi:hypothetical protein